MDNAAAVSRLLNVFSFFVDFDLHSKTDGEALALFLDLLRKDDPFILVTRHGPTFLALARRFGMVPGDGRERLYQKDLPPDQVVDVLTRWARFRADVTDLAGGREFVAAYGEPADCRSVEVSASSASVVAADAADHCQKECP